jgi:hypothetical protein
MAMERDNAAERVARIDKLMADTTPSPADKYQIDRIQARSRAEHDDTRTEKPAPSVGRPRAS